MKFIQARGYTPNRRSQPTLIVMHSMEAVEKPTTAEAVANWFAGPSAPKASAHFCVDNDSIVQCVKVMDVAWHAPGANATGIGIELAGYAKQTRDQWHDAFSRAMLDLAAQLVGKLCWDYGIPLVFLDAAALRAGKSGVTTHWEVTQAFKKSTHTDPGKNFPMAELLFDADTYQVYPEDPIDYV